MTTMVLSEQWRECGFIPAVDVLTPDEAARCRAQFDALEREIPPEAAEVRILDRHLDVEFIWRLATHRRVLDAVEAVLRPDIPLLASNFCWQVQPMNGPTPGPVSAEGCATVAVQPPTPPPNAPTTITIAITVSPPAPAAPPGVRIGPPTTAPRR
jgi:hypothetical protein